VRAAHRPTQLTDEPSTWHVKLATVTRAPPQQPTCRHVPSLEVAVLRLSAGAKTIRHTGSSNARLTIHFGLQLPEGGVSALAGDEFRLMFNHFKEDLH
jgi:hypothetical protein